VPLVVWEYAGEVLLGGLITFLLFRFLGEGRIREALCNLRPDLLVGVGVLLGISAGVWAGLLAILATDFGKWLRQMGEALAYTTALAAPIFISTLAFLTIMFEACSKNRYARYLSTFVLVYSLINLVTMIRNIIGLVGLWQLKDQG